MSSLKPEQHVVQHFTHTHPLTLVNGYGEFTCDACKTYGYGKTYRCDWCNFNLHDHCATCPPTLLLGFMHPRHELQLVFNRPEQKRMCDICDESVQGLYYQCVPCNFDVHPLCTKLPQHVRHVPHPAHLLELSHWGASSVCAVCGGEIRTWRYKCGPCWLDVHMECVISPSASIQQLYYNHPNDCYNNLNYMNLGQVPPVAEAGQKHGRSKGRRMFFLATRLTLGVVSSLVLGVSLDFLMA